jgi:hypothetical protein
MGSRIDELERSLDGMLQDRLELEQSLEESK